MNQLLSLASVLGLAALAQSTHAQSFTFTVENSKTTITGFSAEPSGAVSVPATLGGYTVTEIGRSAFKDRTGITSISFASGASVTKLGATAFQGCTGLQSVNLPSGTTALPVGLLNGCTSLTSVTIPATVTSIGDVAFADCRSLASLTLPASLTTLGESTFLNCRSLSTLSIPSGVTSIPGQAFGECRSLATVSLPAGITKVSYSAFANCQALTGFTLPSSVTALNDSAFQGCSGMTSFAMNASLASIGSQVFEGCSSLSSITVAAANASYSSANGVLFDKSASTLLLCPAGKSGSYAVPAGVTSLAEGALAHCDELSSVTLPAGITSIPADALYYASGVTSLSIPEGVTSIGSWAFAGCAELESVTLPESLTSIGGDAFHYSSNLEEAIFRGNAPTMAANVFDGTAVGFTVYFVAAKTGFTTPTWQGYPAQALGTLPAAISAWLTQQGFASGTDINSDPNQDGVSLLMAYALGLDPSLNLADSMPKPVMSGGNLTLTFKGNAEGISYAAESSTNMLDWGSSGLTLSEPDANGMRTVTMPVTSGVQKRFMRIVIGY